MCEKNPRNDLAPNKALIHVSYQYYSVPLPMLAFPHDDHLLNLNLASTCLLLKLKYAFASSRSLPDSSTPRFRWYSSFLLISKHLIVHLPQHKSCRTNVCLLVQLLFQTVSFLRTGSMDFTPQNLAKCIASTGSQQMLTE